MSVELLTVEAPHAAGVYYLRCGDYIKIGFASDIRTRVKHLAAGIPFDSSLVAWEAARRATETERHLQFARARHRNEWFRLTPELLAHLWAVRSGGIKATSLVSKRYGSWFAKVVVRNRQGHLGRIGVRLAGAMTHDDAVDLLQRYSLADGTFDRESFGVEVEGRSP